jgi:GDPmannose 4,6-dehydratase
MLQQNTPKDYVIATGTQYSVRDFIGWSADALGLEIAFEGSGVNEYVLVTGVNGDKTPGVKKGDIIVRVDERYFRPTEVETLLGDASKAKAELGWEPEITTKEMCIEMVENDLQEAKKNSLLKRNGYQVAVEKE